MLIFSHCRYSVSLPLYLDPEQRLYHQLGLGRRCTVLGTPFISSYARMRLLGVKIPPVYPGDDILLMGGDFILDQSGKLIYSYKTQENERPTVGELLDFMKQHPNESV